jgi:hypothetical protein
MLNKDILEILKQLNEDCPDFHAIQDLSPNLVTSIAYWIKEDRIHTEAKLRSKLERKYKINLS